MNTLYDLLGALPGDDAEDLRAAFRRAVKGAHPDLRPGDPDAALKFRQIVRANEILCDAEQRAAYDHLLALARLEQRLPFARSIAARIHGLASGVIVSAGAGIVAVGCYFLVMQMSAASIAPANDAATAMHASPDIAAVRPAASPDPTSLGSFPAHQFGANDARFFQARGVFVYHDPNGAIANLDQATRLDPNFSTSYMDPGMVSYRPQQFDRAFADVEGAKHIEKEIRPKSMPTTARKPRPDQPGTAPSITSLFQRRTAAKNSPPEDRFASNTFQ
ncbi:curved DNA-binding protein [mine drainage metagenome]|uniref:Curved DNA-binding protein n=1 Tax=mine drainage metagenome TaxID=410659 RepID=A0A1J5PD47_9ZZZZ